MTENVKVVSIQTDGAVNSMKALQDEADRLKAALASLKEGTQQYEETVNQLISVEDKLKSSMDSLDTGKAISSVADLKKHINDLRDSLVTLDSGTDKYQAVVDDLVSAQTKLNEVMAVTRGAVSAQDGSYNALVNKMSALKVAWRSVTSEVQRAQLAEKINEVNNQLKEYDATIGNHQRKVGDYEGAIRTLNTQFDSQKQELRALKTALEDLEPGTEAYNQAFTRAAELTHQLSERQEQLRMSANDLGTQLANVANIGAGVVGGFNAINAIMTLTGQKNDNLQKAMADLQAGIVLVQGLKGLEGAVKAFKSYVNWAAKAYDKIVDWIAGNKKVEKQIQKTTVATQANTTANKANAVAEKQATAGAAGLSAGMSGVAGSTTVATTALRAFKAALISTGIGALVVVLGTLIAKLASSLTEFTGKSKKIYDALAKEGENLIDVETEVNRQLDLQMKQHWELEKAQGKSEIELAKEKYDYYEKRLNRYTDLIVAANDMESKLAAAGYKDNKDKIDWKGSAKEDIDSYNLLGKSILQVEKELEHMEQNGNLYFKKLSTDAIQAFEEIKENGIRTFGDLYTVYDMYGQALAAEKSMYKIDPLGGLQNDIDVQRETILKGARDAIKSEIALENEAYQQQLDSYNWTAEQKAELQRAHWKKVNDIVTGATQSIIDSAKAANQTQLVNLQDAEEKELRELKKYGQLKKQVTITNEEGITKVMTAEEAVRLKYAKERRKIEVDEMVKATENAIAELQRFSGESGPMKKAYDELQAAGVNNAEALGAAQREEFEKTSFALEQAMNYWKDIYEQIENDENVSNEQRLSIHQKYLDAANAVEENRTKYLLDQIKTRKQALDEEIADIAKKYESDEIRRNWSSAKQESSAATFGNVFAGTANNPSFNQQRDSVNTQYLFDRQKLQEQLDAYNTAAEDMSRTDAERLAAREAAAQKQNEILELETENIKTQTQLQIEEYQEVINTIVDVGNSIGDILGTVADAWEDSVNSQLAAGKISQEAADKEFDRISNLQEVQAVINMLAGSVGAFSQASATIPPPYGQIVGAAAAAAVIAQGIAQIVQIENARKTRKASANGGSTMMAQVTPVMPDYQPQMNGTITGEQETEQLANALSKTPIWVSVKDIDDAQERGRVTVAESTF